MSRGYKFNPPMNTVLCLKSHTLVRPDLRFSGDDAKKEPPIPSGLQPKTGLHDYFVSRNPKPADANGITRMDTNFLRDRGDWFRIDGDYAQRIADKKALLQQYRDIVTATLPEGQEGAKELLEMMAEYLPQHFPERFQREGRVIKNLVTQDTYDLDHLPDDPIVVAGLLVQEDLVLLHRGEDGQFRLTSGSVSFPSDWSFPSKLGKTLLEIHQPVTTFNEVMGAAVRNFLDRVSPPPKQYWRINTLISNSSKLTHLPDIPDLHGTEHFKDKFDASTVSSLYLRNEREVFTKLPRSGDVLFSLKTYITPFPQIPPVIARLVATFNRGLPKAFIDGYRKWTQPEEEAILGYLDQKSKEDVAASGTSE
jgi:dimethylamine monooxygenase subunit A